MTRYRTALCALVALLTAGAAGAAPLPLNAPDRTVGTVNCTSSTCHGAIEPWAQSNVLHNEYTTWLRLDRHTRAYAVLKNEVSQNMARKLGLARPAHEEKVCVDCHAHHPRPERRGERHVLSEGIGCEGCHGPAERWIKTHVEPDATHARNLAHGLYPTSRPAAVAELCTSCHVGDRDRRVTHRMMGAGHPRLSFELDTFMLLEPPHYRIDRDWGARKGAWEPARLWAVGQAVAARQMIDLLVDPRTGWDGLFPELTLFDCHACHRRMGEDRWVPRNNLAPGRVRLNDSYLLMTVAVTRVLDPARGTRLADAIARTHQAAAGNGSSREALARDGGRLAQELAATVAWLEQTAFPDRLRARVLGLLLDDAVAAEYADYAGAEQAYMAIASLVAAMDRRGELKATPALRQKLDQVRATLAVDEPFARDAFRRELGALRAALGKGVRP